MHSWQSYSNACGSKRPAVHRLMQRQVLVRLTTLGTSTAVTALAVAAVLGTAGRAPARPSSSSRSPWRQCNTR